MRLGIGRNDRVAIVAAQRAGDGGLVPSSPWPRATTAPLNPAYRAEEFEFYLDDLKPKAWSCRRHGQPARARRGREARRADRRADPDR
jgi:hypothetical protein